MENEAEMREREKGERIEKGGRKQDNLRTKFPLVNGSSEIEA